MHILKRIHLEFCKLWFIVLTHIEQIQVIFRPSGDGNKCVYYVLVFTPAPHAARTMVSSQSIPIPQTPADCPGRTRQPSECVSTTVKHYNCARFTLKTNKLKRHQPRFHLICQANFRKTQIGHTSINWFGANERGYKKTSLVKLAVQASPHMAEQKNQKQNRGIILSPHRLRRTCCYCKPSFLRVTRISLKAWLEETTASSSLGVETADQYHQLKVCHVRILFGKDVSISH